MLGRSSGNHDWLLVNASTCVSCGFRLRNARNASDCVWIETELNSATCWLLPLLKTGTLNVKSRRLHCVTYTPQVWGEREFSPLLLPGLGIDYQGNLGHLSPSSSCRNYSSRFLCCADWQPAAIENSAAAAGSKASVRLAVFQDGGVHMQNMTSFNFITFVKIKWINAKC